MKRAWNKQAGHQREDFSRSEPEGLGERWSSAQTIYSERETGSETQVDLIRAPADCLTDCQQQGPGRGWGGRAGRCLKSMVSQPVDGGTVGQFLFFNFFSDFEAIQRTCWALTLQDTHFSSIQ